MLIINYDLHDLFALFIFFRSFPDKFEKYKTPVEKIAEYLGTPPQINGCDHNTVRKLLRPYADINELSWVFTDNIYTAGISIVKEDKVYEILCAVMKEYLLCGNDTERIISLSDSVHNIPLIIFDSVNKIPLKTIGKFIRDYRKRYNREFLLNEL